MKRCHPLHVAALVLLMSFASGCASFPAHRLPTVDVLPIKAELSNKPSAYISLRFMMDLSSGEKPGYESAAPLPRLRQIVEKVANESALFRTYTFDSFQGKDADQGLQIEITNYGSAAKAVGAGFLTGITLFVIPSAATDNYKLTGKLFDRNGTLIKSYSYDDAVTTWFGIWFLPVAGNTPESAVLSVIENMIRTLFRDIATDGSWQYSERPTGANDSPIGSAIVDR